MMTLKLTGQFKKDLKKYKHATDLLEELEKVLKELQRNGVVSKEHNPHPLIGNYKDCMDCHVKSDFLGPRGIVRGGQMPLPNQRQ